MHSASARHCATLIGHAAELFRILRKSPQNPAQLASAFLHGKKSLDREDKRIVSGLAFSALRASTLLDACVERARSAVPDAPAFDARLAMVSALALPARADLVMEVPCAEVLQEACGIVLAVHEQAVARWFTAVRTSFDSIDADVDLMLRRQDAAARDVASALARRTGTPQWILERLLTSDVHPRTAAEVHALARALMQPALPVLRVNSMRMSREDVRIRLREAGVDAGPSVLVPAGLLLSTRARVTDLPVYTDGDIDIQDEASQLAALALAPESTWHILDACAGAGGKTMHLADLQGDAGSILATDVEPVRLRSLAARAARSGLHSIRTRVVRSDRDAVQSHEDFDAVLVDAPCSGTGTARRTPTVLYRLTPKALDKFAARQRNLLAANAIHVRPGGTLVYATCSLLPDENEDVVGWFLNAHADFEASPLGPAFARSGVCIPGLAADTWHLTLSPSTHGTDGFFIARMQRFR